MAEEKTPEEQSSQTSKTPPAQPPKKKSNTIWWIFGGCGCVTILIIIIAVAVILGLGLGKGINIFKKTIAAPVGPIKGQLKAINDGDIEKAYDYYCSKEFKEATSFEQFKAVVEDNPSIFKSKSSSFNSVNIKNDEATVKGTITGTNNTKTTMNYKMVLEEKRWKILGFTWKR